jgi:hypothetical protein
LVAVDAETAGVVNPTQVAAAAAVAIEATNGILLAVLKETAVVVAEVES